MPPQIHTYHCICTTLLLATTHTLNSLPRRTTPTCEDLILPLSPPSTLSTPTDSLPPQGSTILLSLDRDKKATILRREDGFEKRALYRCSRCRVVVGYELLGQDLSEGIDASGGRGEEDRMDTDEDGDEGSTEEARGKRKDKPYTYIGKVIYLLPGGIQSTEYMGSSQQIGEEDVGIDLGTGTKIAVFE